MKKYWFVPKCPLTSKSVDVGVIPETKMDTPAETPMEIEGEKSDLKIEKNETKLPFSIESLLSDTLNKSEDHSAPSTSGTDADYFKNFRNSEVTVSDDEDRASTESSEPVDVDGTVGGDAQEFIDAKTDYQQSGTFITYKKTSFLFII